VLIGVYTRFWNTAGGGEVYAGTLAEVLAGRHKVELLCEEEVDVARLHDRLGLDLAALPVRVLGDVDDHGFAEATADLDLFVNCSHGSQRPTQARRSVYIVHFPDFRSTTPPASRAAQLVGRRIGSGARIEWRSGIHPEETDGTRRWRWTNATATLLVHAPPGRRVLLELELSTEARPAGTEAETRIVVDGAVGAVVPKDVRRQRIGLPMEGRSSAIPVRIETAPFSPREAFGVDDPRALGVQVERADVVGTAFAERVARRVRPQLLEPQPHDFLRHYTAIVSNSPFTARWIRRRWNFASTVIEPPVTLREGGEKGPVILSVGRFFGPGSGHSKRQLEMVEAFGRLRPQAPGWELHLVGGCSEVDRPYLDLVRDRVGDLPVHIHDNAPKAEVDDLYRRAAIYWHAAGLGEDSSSHPERMEHFGISVVEAMSAGAVPVVFAEGGPSEIVREGHDGLHFHSADELVAHTVGLVTDEPRRRALATAAVARAGEYGRPRFEEKVWRLLDDLGS
jgi:glycosyltransferase involved in cell wall biosynthesis